MLKNLSSVIHHRHSTKLFSLLLGYGLWFFVAQYQTVMQSFPVQVYLYDAHHQQVTTPSSVQVTVLGSRKDMYHFDKKNAAIHVDSSSYDFGSHEIVLQRENLFLPDTIKLIDLEPSCISIHTNPT